MTKRKQPTRSRNTKQQPKRRYKFHGSFAKKSDAKVKEAATPGAWIEPVTIHGKRRYSVMTRIG